LVNPRCDKNYEVFLVAIGKCADIGIGDMDEILVAGIALSAYGKAGITGHVTELFR